MKTLTALEERVEAQPWSALTEEIDAYGCAQTGPLLTPDECAEFSAMWADPGRFRSTIDMARYRFGHGTYRYFADPVPAPIMRLRRAFYRRLLPIARTWAERVGDPMPWPDEFDAWLAACHAVGLAPRSATASVEFAAATDIPSAWSCTTRNEMYTLTDAHGHYRAHRVFSPTNKPPSSPVTDRARSVCLPYTPHGKCTPAGDLTFRCWGAST